MTGKSNSARPFLARPSSSRPAPLPAPERLVGVGFRCWLAGYRTGDIGCWETAWNAYATALGPRVAREALSELGVWVRLVRDAARREIEVCPVACRGFCRDECLAIGMVAASQHGVCPAMNACAIALLDNSSMAEVEDVVEGARGFALILRLSDQVLSPAAMIDAGRLDSRPSVLAWH